MAAVAEIVEPASTMEHSSVKLDGVANEFPVELKKFEALQAMEEVVMKVGYMNGCNTEEPAPVTYEGNGSRTTEGESFSESPPPADVAVERYEAVKEALTYEKQPLKDVTETRADDVVVAGDPPENKNLLLIEDADQLNTKVKEDEYEVRDTTEPTIAEHSSLEQVDEKLDEEASDENPEESHLTEDVAKPELAHAAALETETEEVKEGDDAGTGNEVPEVETQPRSADIPLDDIDDAPVSDEVMETGIPTAEDDVQNTGQCSPDEPHVAESEEHESFRTLPSEEVPEAKVVDASEAPEVDGSKGIDDVSLVEGENIGNATENSAVENEVEDCEPENATEDSKPDAPIVEEVTEPADAVKEISSTEDQVYEAPSTAEQDTFDKSDETANPIAEDGDIITDQQCRSQTVLENADAAGLPEEDIDRTEGNVEKVLVEEVTAEKSEKEYTTVDSEKQEILEQGDVSLPNTKLEYAEEKAAAQDSDDAHKKSEAALEEGYISEQPSTEVMEAAEGTLEDKSELTASNVSREMDFSDSQHQDSVSGEEKKYEESRELEAQVFPAVSAEILDNKENDSAALAENTEEEKAIESLDLSSAAEVTKSEVAAQIEDDDADLITDQECRPNEVNDAELKEVLTRETDLPEAVLETTGAIGSTEEHDDDKENATDVNIESSLPADVLEQKCSEENEVKADGTDEEVTVQRDIGLMLEHDDKDNAAEDAKEAAVHSDVDIESSSPAEVTEEKCSEEKEVETALEKSDGELDEYNKPLEIAEEVTESNGTDEEVNVQHGINPAREEKCLEQEDRRTSEAPDTEDGTNMAEVKEKDGETIREVVPETEAGEFSAEIEDAHKQTISEEVSVSSEPEKKLDETTLVDASLEEKVLSEQADDGEGKVDESETLKEKLIDEFAESEEVPAPAPVEWTPVEDGDGTEANVEKVLVEEKQDSLEQGDSSIPKTEEVSAEEEEAATEDSDEAAPKEGCVSEQLSTDVTEAEEGTLEGKSELTASSVSREMDLSDSQHQDSVSGEEMKCEESRELEAQVFPRASSEIPENKENEIDALVEDTDEDKETENLELSSSAEVTKSGKTAREVVSETEVRELSAEIEDAHKQTSTEELSASSEPEKKFEETTLVNASPEEKVLGEEVDDEEGKVDESVALKDQVIDEVCNSEEIPASAPVLRETIEDGDSTEANVEKVLVEETTGERSEREYTAEDSEKHEILEQGDISISKAKLEYAEEEEAAVQDAPEDGHISEQPSTEVLEAEEGTLEDKSELTSSGVPREVHLSDSRRRDSVFGEETKYEQSRELEAQTEILDNAENESAALVDEEKANGNESRAVESLELSSAAEVTTSEEVAPTVDDADKITDRECQPNEVDGAELQEVPASETELAETVLQTTGAIRLTEQLDEKENTANEDATEATAHTGVDIEPSSPAEATEEKCSEEKEVERNAALVPEVEAGDSLRATSLVEDEANDLSSPDDTVEPETQERDIEQEAVLKAQVSESAEEVTDASEDQTPEAPVPKQVEETFPQPEECPVADDVNENTDRDITATDIETIEKTVATDDTEKADGSDEEVTVQHDINPEADIAPEAREEKWLDQEDTRTDEAPENEDVVNIQTHDETIADIHEEDSKTAREDIPETEAHEISAEIEDAPKQAIAEEVSVTSEPEKKYEETTLVNASLEERVSSEEVDDGEEKVDESEALREQVIDEVADSEEVSAPAAVERTTIEDGDSTDANVEKVLVEETSVDRCGREYTAEDSDEEVKVQHGINPEAATATAAREEKCSEQEDMRTNEAPDTEDVANIRTHDETLAEVHEKDGEMAREFIPETEARELSAEIEDAHKQTISEEVSVSSEPEKKLDETTLVDASLEEKVVSEQVDDGEGKVDESETLKEKLIGELAESEEVPAPAPVEWTPVEDGDSTEANVEKVLIEEKQDILEQDVSSIPKTEQEYTEEEQPTEDSYEAAPKEGCVFEQPSTDVTEVVEGTLEEKSELTASSVSTEIDLSDSQHQDSVSGEETKCEESRELEAQVFPAASSEIIENKENETVALVENTDEDKATEILELSSSAEVTESEEVAQIIDDAVIITDRECRPSEVYDAELQEVPASEAFVPEVEVSDSLGATSQMEDEANDVFNPDDKHDETGKADGTDEEVKAQHDLNPEAAIATEAREKEDLKTDKVPDTEVEINESLEDPSHTEDVNIQTHDGTVAEVQEKDGETAEEVVSETEVRELSAEIEDAHKQKITEEVSASSEPEKKFEETTLVNASTEEEVLGEEVDEVEGKVDESEALKDEVIDEVSNSEEIHASATVSRETIEDGDSTEANVEKVYTAEDSKKDEILEQGDISISKAEEEEVAVQDDPEEGRISEHPSAEVLEAEEGALEDKSELTSSRVPREMDLSDSQHQDSVSGEETRYEESRELEAQTEIPENTENESAEVFDEEKATRNESRAIESLELSSAAEVTTSAEVAPIADDTDIITDRECQPNEVDDAKLQEVPASEAELPETVLETTGAIRLTEEHDAHDNSAEDTKEATAQTEVDIESSSPAEATEEICSEEKEVERNGALVPEVEAGDSLGATSQVEDEANDVSSPDDAVEPETQERDIEQEAMLEAPVSESAEEVTDASEDQTPEAPLPKQVETFHQPEELPVADDVNENTDREIMAIATSGIETIEKNAATDDTENADVSDKEVTVQHDINPEADIAPEAREEKWLDQEDARTDEAAEKEDVVNTQTHGETIADIHEKDGETAGEVVPETETHELSSEIEDAHTQTVAEEVSVTSEPEKKYEETTLVNAPLQEKVISEEVDDGEEKIDESEALREQVIDEVSDSEEASVPAPVERTTIEYGDSTDATVERVLVEETTVERCGSEYTTEDSEKQEIHEQGDVVIPKTEREHEQEDEATVQDSGEAAPEEVCISEQPNTEVVDAEEGTLEDKSELTASSVSREMDASDYQHQDSVSGEETKYEESRELEAQVFPAVSTEIPENKENESAAVADNTDEDKAIESLELSSAAEVTESEAAAKISDDAEDQEHRPNEVNDAEFKEELTSETVLPEIVHETTDAIRRTEEHDDKDNAAEDAKEVTVHTDVEVESSSPGEVLEESCSEEKEVETNVAPVPEVVLSESINSTSRMEDEANDICSPDDTVYPETQEREIELANEHTTSEQQCKENAEANDSIEERVSSGEVQDAEITLRNETVDITGQTKTDEETVQSEESEAPENPDGELGEDSKPLEEVAESEKAAEYQTPEASVPEKVEETFEQPEECPVADDSNENTDREITATATSDIEMIEKSISEEEGHGTADMDAAVSREENDDTEKADKTEEEVNAQHDIKPEAAIATEAREEQEDVRTDEAPDIEVEVKESLEDRSQTEDVVNIQTYDGTVSEVHEKAREVVPETEARDFSAEIEDAHKQIIAEEVSVSSEPEKKFEETTIVLSEEIDDGEGKVNGSEALKDQEIDEVSSSEELPAPTPALRETIEDGDSVEKVLVEETTAERSEREYTAEDSEKHEILEQGDISKQEEEAAVQDAPEEGRISEQPSTEVLEAEEGTLEDRSELTSSSVPREMDLSDSQHEDSVSGEETRYEESREMEAQTENPESTENESATLVDEEKATGNESRAIESLELSSAAEVTTSDEVEKVLVDMAEDSDKQEILEQGDISISETKREYAEEEEVTVQDAPEEGCISEQPSTEGTLEDKSELTAISFSREMDLSDSQHQDSVSGEETRYKESRELEAQTEIPESTENESATLFDEEKAIENESRELEAKVFPSVSTENTDEERAIEGLELSSASEVTNFEEAAPIADDADIITDPECRSNEVDEAELQEVPALETELPETVRKTTDAIRLTEEHDDKKNVSENAKEAAVHTDVDIESSSPAEEVEEKCSEEKEVETNAMLVPEVEASDSLGATSPAEDEVNGICSPEDHTPEAPLPEKVEVQQPEEITATVTSDIEIIEKTESIPENERFETAATDAVRSTEEEHDDDTEKVDGTDEEVKVQHDIDPEAAIVTDAREEKCLEQPDEVEAPDSEVEVKESLETRSFTEEVVNIQTHEETVAEVEEKDGETAREIVSETGSHELPAEIEDAHEQITPEGVTASLEEKVFSEEVDNGQEKVDENEALKEQVINEVAESDEDPAPLKRATIQGDVSIPKTEQECAEEEEAEVQDSGHEHKKSGAAAEEGCISDEPSTEAIHEVEGSFEDKSELTTSSVSREMDVFDSQHQDSVSEEETKYEQSREFENESAASVEKTDVEEVIESLEMSSAAEVTKSEEAAQIPVKDAEADEGREDFVNECDTERATDLSVEGAEVTEELRAETRTEEKFSGPEDSETRNLKNVEEDTTQDDEQRESAVEVKEIALPEVSNDEESREDAVQPEYDVAAVVDERPKDEEEAPTSTDESSSNEKQVADAVHEERTFVSVEQPQAVVDATEEETGTEALAEESETVKLSSAAEVTKEDSVVKEDSQATEDIPLEESIIVIDEKDVAEVRDEQNVEQSVTDVQESPELSPAAEVMRERSIEKDERIGDAVSAANEAAEAIPHAEDEESKTEYAETLSTIERSSELTLEALETKTTEQVELDTETEDIPAGLKDAEVRSLITEEETTEVGKQYESVVGENDTVREEISDKEGMSGIVPAEEGNLEKEAIPTAEITSSLISAEDAEELVEEKSSEATEIKSGEAEQDKAGKALEVNEIKREELFYDEISHQEKVADGKTAEITSIKEEVIEKGCIVAEDNSATLSESFITEVVEGDKSLDEGSSSPVEETKEVQHVEKEIPEAVAVERRDIIEERTVGISDLVGSKTNEVSEQQEDTEIKERHFELTTGNLVAKEHSKSIIEETETVLNVASTEEKQETFELHPAAEGTTEEIDPENKPKNEEVIEEKTETLKISANELQNQEEVVEKECALDEGRAGSENDLVFVEMPETKKSSLHEEEGKIVIEEVAELNVQSEKRGTDIGSSFQEEKIFEKEGDLAREELSGVNREIKQDERIAAATVEEMIDPVIPTGKDIASVKLEETAAGTEAARSPHWHIQEPTLADTEAVPQPDLLKAQATAKPQAAPHILEPEGAKDRLSETQAEEVEMAKAEEAKTDEERDEHDEDEHRRPSPDQDTPVMVEAYKDMDVKAHKRSHNILSGVGSKVKHSISKVKKAITGKSSHSKTVSPKQGL